MRRKEVFKRVTKHGKSTFIVNVEIVFEINDQVLEEPNITVWASSQGSRGGWSQGGIPGFTLEEFRQINTGIEAAIVEYEESKQNSTELTDEEKLEIFADFKEWSGGYSPAETPPKDQDTYIEAALDTKFKLRKNAVRDWFDDLETA